MMIGILAARARSLIEGNGAGVKLASRSALMLLFRMFD